MSANGKVEPFIIKDCALLKIVTGKKAQKLREMRDQLLAVSLGISRHVITRSVTGSYCSRR
jgi:hypothetical protein